ncbi:MAG: hypothetical protein Q4C99_01720 [Clostridia bacterium]|nr:hypothetical protein [Clostridia bacterium]
MKIKSIGRSKFLPLVISVCLILASVMPFGIAGVFAASQSTVSELIDADTSLLKWNADKTQEVTVTVDGTEFTVNDETSYDEAYSMLMSAMKLLATSPTEIPAQTVSDDQIWNISGTVTMTGTVTITGRLVIVGDGILTRNGAYSFSSTDSFLLQDNVICDGGGEDYNARFLSSTGTDEKHSQIYLADSVQIKNYKVENITGAGFSAAYTDFYMSGGTIGSEDLTITWDDGVSTKYGNETETYLSEREAKGEYPYFTKIQTKYGCDVKGTNTSGYHGGGISIYSSDFYMSGGSIVGNTLLGTITGTSSTNRYTMSGAGIYAQATNLYITGGKISANQSNTTSEADSYYYQYSGAIQLGGTSNKVCEITNAEISYNYSQMWVGAMDISPGNTVKLNNNAIFKYNRSRNNSGAIAVDGTGSVMYMEAGSQVIHNYAGGLGGAIRCLGKLYMNGGQIAYNKSVSNAAGLSVQTDMRRGEAVLNGGTIHDNYSLSNGGGTGVVIGYQGDTSSITLNGTYIYDNKCNGNGGGMYVDANKGVVNVTLNKGYVYGNSATNGGGIYVNQTNDSQVTFSSNDSSVRVENNVANQDGGGIFLFHQSNSSGFTNIDFNNGTVIKNIAGRSGGGIYQSSGDLIVNGGSITDNTASVSGGGAYLGTGSNIVVNDGSFSRNNAINGGGVYIADGTVRMYGGTVGFNKSTKDGGGIYVSASSTPADVVIRSGSIINNTAGSKSAPANGGGIAVESGGSPTADVITIGLLETHKDLQVSTHTFTPFDYEEEYDGKKVHNHASCPVLENNVAYASGGGIYMGSNLATLNIYCMLEDKNTAHAGDESDGVMSVGGTINIGDHENNNPNARGNVIVNSPMFVSGGDVTVSGNMDNPYFKNNVLVDIKNNSGSFKDNRYYIESAKEYKVHYFENFKGDSDTASGVYKVLQYNQDATIYAEGAMYIHEGWRILEWNTEPDGTGTQYKIGSTIASSSDHTAWGENDNDPLVLYAIWTRNTYTVKYEPNANEYTGSMANEVFEYNVEKRLSENKYKVSGMRFVGWNTMSDGSGTAYSSDYSESKLSKVNGSTVTLYAQWVKCTHKGGDHPGTLSYTVSGNSLTESCDCGGYTVTATLRAADAYHDGKTHPATLNLTGTFLAGNPTVSYVYSETEDGTFGALANGETLPTSTGWYIASITVEGKTVSVKYQIKSPTEGLAQEAKAVAKQVFSDFNGETKPSVQQDDSFTTEFTVRNLNADTFTVAPVLSFSASLPSGTSIIMQTGGKYWYLNDASGKSIDLTSFTQMGTDTKFAYTFDANQNYRFIIDFSKASSYLSGDLTVNLTYEYLNNPDDSVVLSTAVSLKSKENFALSYTNGALTITAPQSDNYHRYNNRELVLVLNSTNLPSDARIVASAGDKTKIYYINQNGDIVIPIVWAQTRQISLKFVSDFANQQGKNYTFNIAECVGADPNGSSDTAAVEYRTGVTAQATIDVDDKVEPSLKIEGAQRLLKSTDTLSLDITTKNVDGYTLSATIQKKNGDDYDGNFLSADIKDGKNDFSLSSIKTEGSYRVLVSVISSDGTTVLTVPYYFIVL